MRSISLYLHEYVIETLKCFGDLNTVINRLLEQTINTGLIFDNDLSSAPDRDGARRVNVYIDDEIIASLGTVKIRPAVYWFVDNEVYSELSWTMVREYKEEQKNKVKVKLNKIIADLTKLKNYDDRLTNVIDELERVLNET